MNATANLFLSKSGEPPFDQIDPGGAGRREVHVETGTFGQPCADGRGFVSAVVVQNQMDVQRRGHCLLDGVEKLAEFHTAVPAMAGADHRSSLHIERGKQGRGAVALVNRDCGARPVRDASATAVASGPAPDY